MQAADETTLTIRYGGCLDGYEEVKRFGSHRELRRYLRTQVVVSSVGGTRHILCRYNGDRSVLKYIPSGPTPKLLGTFLLS